MKPFIFIAGFLILLYFVWNYFSSKGQADSEAAARAAGKIGTSGTGTTTSGGNDTGWTIEQERAFGKTGVLT